MSDTIHLLTRLLVALVATCGPGVAAVPAPDDPPPARFEPGDFELLPLPPVRRELFSAEHDALLGSLRSLVRARADLARKLRERQDQGDQTSQGLAKRIAGIESELAARVDELCAALTEQEIDDEDLSRIRSAPDGELRVERYAHSLVLGLETLTAAQRELLVPVVHALDGALLALRSQERQLESSPESDEDAATGRAMIANLQSRRRQIQRRFWTMIDYALDDQQRATLHERLPSRYQQPPDVMTHLLQLPGLTPSQASRFRAFFAEYESETAADQAGRRRLRSQLADRTLTKEARAELGAELAVTRLRAARLTFELAESGKAILTPAQWRSFLAIPPMLTAGDRRRTPEQLVAELGLTEEQRGEFQARAASYQQIRRALQQEAAEMRKGMADVGPDSPQMEMMNSMTQSLQGRASAALRRLLHEVFLEVLTPPQVVEWLTGR